MNREIKFKGLTFDKIWIYGSYYFHNKEKLGILSSYIVDENFNRYTVENNTICQYINEKDIKNKEIYEGDIVISSTKYMNKKDWIGLIKWSNEHLGFVVELDNGKFWMPILDVEVIGNIFENPELL